MEENRPLNFAAPRVLLLIEIERYCSQPDCPKLNRIGLTKSEASEYDGFTCERCETWNDDELSEKDAPEWWREINRKSDGEHL
jgi:hypothetical protein